MRSLHEPPGSALRAARGGDIRGSLVLPHIASLMQATFGGPPRAQRNEIASPLRSAFTIRPVCRPLSCSTAPFSLVSTIARTPLPTAAPAPPAPYTPATSEGL